MASLWRWYCSSLEKAPAITKALTSGVVFAAGDAALQTQAAAAAAECQAPEDASEAAAPSAKLGCGILASSPADSVGAAAAAASVDLVRCGKVGATAMLWNGPATHYWYMALEHGMRGFRPGLLNLATRLAADAFIFTPVALPGYFVVRGLLEGLPAERIQNKIRDKYVDTIMTSWSFWPLANIVNFSLVPLQFRVLYNNTLSLGWSAILSSAHSAPEPAVAAALGQQGKQGQAAAVTAMQ